MSESATHEDLAFAAGSDLWIVPERKNSEMAQRMDWYLNFQIAKASHHQTRSLELPLQNILQECEIGTETKTEKVIGDLDSLLILSSKYFPNRWVLVLKGCDDVAAWAEKAVEKWKKMQSPSLRVFLPENLSSGQFEKLWSKFGGSSSLTIVADQDEKLHG